MAFRFARLCLFAPLISLGACASIDQASLPIEQAVAQVSAMQSAADRLRMDVEWLADDARLGRETGSETYREAASYVAARMETLGLTPGVDGAWFQEVPLRTSSPILEESAFAITTSEGVVHTLTHLDDFRVFPSVDAASFEIDNAPAVFLGYGVHAPAFGHDDYAGVDLEGKVAVYFSGAPDVFDSESRAHFNSGGLKAHEASSRGAIGAITLYTSATEKSRPWARFIANPNYTSMTWVWPDGRAETSGPGIKGSVTLNPEKSALIFDGAEHDYASQRAAADGEGEAPKSFDLAVTVSMAGAVKRDEVTSPNVVGMIPGADPALKNQYVVLTAHLDHIGVNKRLVLEGKDGIRNGAMDNATGVATLLEAARTFMAGEPPARSILIVALTGEEKGLLGADYFAHFPPIGGGEMVANVNLDMPVMLYSFTDVVGFGAERSSLGVIMGAALEQTGVALSPDPIPELGIFTRSDHYRFVEKGVPSIFLWPGFANGGEEAFWDFYRNHYHRPSDDLSQPILFDDMVRFADINMIIARAIADAVERPTWNEGDFFGDLFGGE